MEVIIVNLVEKVFDQVFIGLLPHLTEARIVTRVRIPAHPLVTLVIAYETRRHSGLHAGMRTLVRLLRAKRENFLGGATLQSVLSAVCV